MNIAVQGFKAVAAAGTKVQLTTDTTIRCSKLIIAPPASQTGYISVGDSTMVASTGVGRMAKLPISGVPFVIEDQEELDGIFPSQLWIDASVSGEGADITFVL